MFVRVNVQRETYEKIVCINCLYIYIYKHFYIYIFNRNVFTFQNYMKFYYAKM